MPIVRLNLPLYMPSWLHSALRGVKHAITNETGLAITLEGDRDIEWTYIASRLPAGPGAALDFGCGFANLSLLLAQRGFQVTGVDLLEYPRYWEHPLFKFVQGDFLGLEFTSNSFDVIVNCSAVEHVGLSGRYDVAQTETGGDLKAMERMAEVLKTSGVMLLTIPCGRDAVFSPLHRVYGAQRLPQLLRCFEVEEQCFWAKRADNHWMACDRETALSFEATANFETPAMCSYALGCFKLRKPAAES
jgi:SAM-dependent methyltransferase